MELARVSDEHSRSKRALRERLLKLQSAERHARTVLGGPVPPAIPLTASHFGMPLRQLATDSCGMRPSMSSSTLPALGKTSMLSDGLQSENGGGGEDGIGRTPSPLSEPGLPRHVGSSSWDSSDHGSPGTVGLWVPVPLPARQQPSSLGRWNLAGATQDRAGLTNGRQSALPRANQSQDSLFSLASSSADPSFPPAAGSHFNALRYENGSNYETCNGMRLGQCDSSAGLPHSGNPFAGDACLSGLPDHAGEAAAVIGRSASGSGGEKHNASLEASTLGPQSILPSPLPSPWADEAFQAAPSERASPLPRASPAGLAVPGTSSVPMPQREPPPLPLEANLAWAPGTNTKLAYSRSSTSMSSQQRPPGLPAAVSALAMGQAPSRTNVLGARGSLNSSGVLDNSVGELGWTSMTMDDRVKYVALYDMQVTQRIDTHFAAAQCPIEKQ